MNIETWTTILLAIAPAVAAVITVLGGFLSLIKTIKSIKNNNNETVIKSQERLEKLEKKINILTTKLTSLEQFLIEQKEKK